MVDKPLRKSGFFHIFVFKDCCLGCSTYWPGNEYLFKGRLQLPFYFLQELSMLFARANTTESLYYKPIRDQYYFASLIRSR